MKRSTPLLDVPHYSLPETVVPEALSRQTASDAFGARRTAIQDELFESARASVEGRPTFITFLSDDGVVVIPRPDGAGACLPVFSSRVGALDYQQSLLADHERLRILESRPEQLVGLLDDLGRHGVDSFTIDRCPRCSDFTCVGSAGIEGVDRLLQFWSIFSATKIAMADAFHGYSLAAVRRGDLAAARDASLDAARHLAVEDPRFHLLLAKIAVAEHDRILLEEARAFLRFLDLPEWEQLADDAERSGRPDLGKPPPPRFGVHPEKLLVRVDWRVIDLGRECGLPRDATTRDWSVAYYPKEGTDAWVVWIQRAGAPFFKLDTDTGEKLCLR